MTINADILGLWTIVVVGAVILIPVAVIGWVAARASRARRSAARLVELDGLLASGLITVDEHARQRARVIAQV